MKKLIPLLLFTLVLAGAGCTTQKLDPSVKDEIATYSGDFFKMTYPNDWTSAVNIEGISTTITFTSTDDVQVFSVVVLPNQAGDTTSSRVSHLLETSPWIQTGTRSISGNSASIVELGESEAGPRYIFVTTPEDAMSYIFDIQTVGLDTSVVDAILNNFVVAS